MPGTISGKLPHSSVDTLFDSGDRLASLDCLQRARQISDRDVAHVSKNGHEFTPGIDPEAEHQYWRMSFHRRIYVDWPDDDYELYASAYQFGWESYAQFGKDGDGYEVEFDDIEHDLGLVWDERSDGKGLTWTMARPATRDAWERSSYISRQSVLRKKPR